MRGLFPRAACEGGGKGERKARSIESKKTYSVDSHQKGGLRGRNGFGKLKEKRQGKPPTSCS